MVWKSEWSTGNTTEGDSLSWEVNWSGGFSTNIWNGITWRLGPAEVLARAATHQPFYLGLTSLCGDGFLIGLPTWWFGTLSVTVTSKQEGICRAFYDLSLEVTWHHLYPTLSVKVFTSSAKLKVKRIKKLATLKGNECQKMCSPVLNFCKSNNVMLIETKEVNRMRIEYIWKYWNASMMH